MRTHLTVQNLLSVLIAVGGLTLGLFTYDAERAIGRLDELAKVTAEVHETTSVLDNRVSVLNTRVDAFGNIVTDHEKRITSIEARHER
jgi:hypothetical protein